MRRLYKAAELGASRGNLRSLLSTFEDILKWSEGVSNQTLFLNMFFIPSGIRRVASGCFWASRDEVWILTLRPDGSMATLASAPC